jgi:hypothetical protein
MYRTIPGYDPILVFKIFQDPHHFKLKTTLFAWLRRKHFGKKIFIRNFLQTAENYFGFFLHHRVIYGSRGNLYMYDFSESRWWIAGFLHNFLAAFLNNYIQLLRLSDVDEAWRLTKVPETINKFIKFIRKVICLWKKFSLTAR